MAPHSSTLAWKIPWTEEPAVHGVAEGWTRLSDFTLTFHFHALEKEMETHSSVLVWRIPGTGEPGGLPSMGLHRVRHDWRDLAAAAEPLQVYTLSHKLLVNNPRFLIIHPKSVLLCYICMYYFLSPCFSDVCIITSAIASWSTRTFPQVLTDEIFSNWAATLCQGLSVPHMLSKMVSSSPARWWVK